MISGATAEQSPCPSQRDQSTASFRAPWSEWYGNGSWAPGTTVHAKLNGGEHVSHTSAPDGGWHTWRTQWDEAGMRFWLDYVDGAQPYFDVPASSLPDWPFNTPGYTLFPILNLAVAGSGGGGLSLSGGSLLR